MLYLIGLGLGDERDITLKGFCCFFLFFSFFFLFFLSFLVFLFSFFSSSFLYCLLFISLLFLLFFFVLFFFDFSSSLTKKKTTGLEAIKSCDIVLLEHYTSLLGVDRSRLVYSFILLFFYSFLILSFYYFIILLFYYFISSSSFIYFFFLLKLFFLSSQKKETLYGKKVELADRDGVEQLADSLILEPSKTKNVAFLVVGDPFGFVFIISSLFFSLSLSLSLSFLKKNRREIISLHQSGTLFFK